MGVCARGQRYSRRQPFGLPILGLKMYEQVQLSLLSGGLNHNSAGRETKSEALPQTIRINLARIDSRVLVYYAYFYGKVECTTFLRQNKYQEKARDSALIHYCSLSNDVLARI